MGWTVRFWFGHGLENRLGKRQIVFAGYLDVGAGAFDKMNRR